MNKFLELKRYCRTNGFWATLQRLKMRYLSTEDFTLYRWDLTTDFQGIELGPEYTVVKDDFALLDRIRFSRDDLPREFYADRTHGGKHFYLVFKNYEPAYIHWVFFKGDYSRFFILSNSSAEVNYNTTLPGFMGDKLMAKVMNYIGKDLRAEGYKTMVGAVSNGTLYAHKSMARTGFVPFIKSKSVCSIVTVRLELSAS
jgi:hypothetical protein